MKTRGVKFVDPGLETVQIDWMLVPANECRDERAEYRYTVSFFRKPHEPWGPERAFVRPVQIRRSRRRVLFWQCSGLED